LLLAACLEARGLQPLIAIVKSQGNVRHALLGSWKKRRAGLQAVLLQKEELLEKDVWLDPNGMTRDVAHRQEFAESLRAGTAILREQELEFALDVTAARREGVRPLPFAGTPRWSEAAARALSAAAQFAQSFPTRVSTIPLLLSLLEANDGFTRLVFSQCFEDIGAVSRKLRSFLPRRPPSDTPSRNYAQALDLAAVTAKREGSPLILERHLLVALLGLEGTVLDRALQQVGGRREELLSALHAFSARSGLKQSYSAFSEFYGSRRSLSS